MSWEPIDTAPRDGTVVLLAMPPCAWRPMPFIRMGRFVETIPSYWWCQWWDLKGDDVTEAGPVPTHWQPLPDLWTR